MATNQWSILPKQTTATLIVSAGDGPTLVTNTDLKNTVFLGDTDSIRSTDSQGIVPLGPNGSVTVNGQSDLFAVNPNTSTVIIATLTGGLANFLGLTQGLGALAIPSIFSPNFIHNLAGWTINQDGSAELNNVIIRGSTLTGTLTAGNTLQINQNGWFLYAGTPTGPTANGTFAKVGGLIQAQSFNASTCNVTINPAGVGHFIVLHVITNNGGNNPVPPTGVSGGNCNWQQIGNTFTGTNNVGFASAVYLGTATATGSAVATVSFTGSVNSSGIAGQEYSSSTGQCTFITQNTLDSTGTNTMPSITSIAGELYSVFENDNVGSVAGSTPGYTYELDAFSNGLCFNENCSAGVQAPTFGDATCAFGIAVLLQAGVTPGNLILAGASAAGTDGVGNPYVEGLNVFAGSISGASIVAGNTVTIDSTGVKIYNGAATSGNLQLTISPTGAINTMAPIILGKRSSTPAIDPNSGATVYTTTGGLMVVDGADGNVYQTQRSTRILRAPIGFTSTALSDTGLHLPVVSGRTYRFSGLVYIQAPAANPGLVEFQLAAPGGTTGQIGFLLVRATVTATQNVAPNVTAAIFQTVINNQYLCFIEGAVVPSANGTISLSAGNQNAGTSFSLETFSFLDFMTAN